MYETLIGVVGFGTFFATSAVAAWQAFRHWYVRVSPDEYVIHYRSGRIVTQGLGHSFLCLPTDTFIKIPSTIRDVNFVADQITKEKQGVRVQGFLAYKVVDFEQAYQSLDLRSKSLKVLASCEEAVEQKDYKEKNCEKVVALDPSDALAKTDLVIRRLAESVVRHEVSNKTLDQMITERETVIQSMKEQMQATLSSWGIQLDTIEFTEVWIRSKEVFENLQAEFRNQARAEATRSTTLTEKEIAERKLAAEEEIARLSAQAERQRRITQSEEQKAARLQEIANSAQVKEKELEDQLKAQRRLLENQRELERVAKEKEFALRQKELELAQAEELAKLLAQVARQAEQHKVEMDKREKLAMIRQQEVEAARVLAERQAKAAIEAAELERQKEEVEARARLEAEKAKAEERLVEVEAAARELERMAAAERQKAAELAEALRKKGEAEAEATRLAVEARNAISPTQIQQLFVEALPQVALAMKPENVRWINFAGGGAGGAGGSPMQMVPETLAKVLAVFQGMGIDAEALAKGLSGRKPEADGTAAEGGPGNLLGT